MIASRDFITEGEFLPEITARTAVTERLATAPPLLGYVATTAKGTATTSLRIGPDRDPLLATWQAGLGQVTSWTSDASAALVEALGRRGTATSASGRTWSRTRSPPATRAGAAQAPLAGRPLSIELDAERHFPDGATALAVVAGPDGQRIEVPLERTARATVRGRRAGPPSGVVRGRGDGHRRRPDGALVAPPGERELPARVPARPGRQRH